jgi:hypothetical protein
MSTTLRTAAAFHQAGDAISALALGYSVWAVWVDDQHGECARALVLDAYDAAVILFASAIAQCRGAPSTSIGASNLARFNRIVDRDASHVTATGELVTSTGASTDSRTAIGSGMRASRTPSGLSTATGRRSSEWQKR